MTRGCALVVVAIVAAIAATGTAARAEVDPATRARAAAHFKQGQAFFRSEDYDRALAEYPAAFDLSAEPSLVFNIALCHDRAQRPEPALAAFRRYLELAPDGPVADEAREDVARLAPIVDRIVAERTARAAREDEVRLRDEDARRKREAPPPPPREAPSRVPRYLVIAGAAIAVGGAASHVLAWRTRDRMASAPDPDAYYADRETFGLERNIAIGAYAAGALTIAAGVILGHTVLAGDAQLSASLTPGGAALAIGWSR